MYGYLLSTTKWLSCIKKCRIFLPTPCTKGEDSVLERSETNVVGVKPKVENIKNGTFVVVEFYTARKVSIKYKYAAICLSDIEDDGEVKVMCMRVMKDSGRLFKVDEKDVSYVDFTQIVSVLPQPNIKQVRNSVFYEFEGNVDVLER
jgi:hypothetical protein